MTITILRAREYSGYIDSVRHRTVTGWARGKSGERPVLCVRVNGCDIGFTTPTQYRPDLVDNAGCDGYYGFEFPVPDSVGPLASVSVTIVTNGFSLPFSSDSAVCPRSNRCLPPEWRRRADQFRLPSFFLLGAAKCGTTALHTYLAQHPDVCMSNPKEPFYFEAEYQRGAAFYFNRYFSHWQHEPIVGESRHRNLYLPYVPERIFGFNPEAKLIVILRNPVERAVSHWWHWYSRGTDPLPLREAVVADWKRIQSSLQFNTPEERGLYTRTLDEQGQGRYRTYIDTGYYYDQLQRFVNIFGKERLCVFLFEDLVKDARQVTVDALRFLAADPAPANEFEYPVLNASSPGMRESADDWTIAWLVDHYRTHNKSIEEFLGRSLAAWDDPFAI